MTSLSNSRNDPASAPVYDDSIAVSDFDAAETADAAAELVPCCASRRWISELVVGRPYRSLDALTRRSDAVLARLDWMDLMQAITPAASSSWPSGADADERLTDARRRYEHKFGYRLLICTTGLSTGQVLDVAERRVANDVVAERAVVAAELSKIVRQRLAHAFH